ncbi:hypothetical protein [Streptomyces sp. NPDC056240]|uniref:hypothetical protein n=1 Tax=Streptomyces sp. NPDC056240 TaxID=3345759 RepID=UPI0035E22CAA
MVKANPKERGIDSDVQGIGPGSYRTTGDLADCYWERTAKSGQIIDNNFAMSAQLRASGTVEPDQEGTSQGICCAPGGVKLSDLSSLMARCDDGGLSYDSFRVDPALTLLQWPDDVLKQFLFDHGDNAAFVYGYGGIDLFEITWRLETIPAPDFKGMPTGASDAGCIESFAENPVHWVTVRPAEVGRHWEEHGTWMRPPILIDRRLLDPSDRGLQVVEGRTRVGVLRGRIREGLHVASRHQAWVGHPTTVPGVLLSAAKRRRHSWLYARSSAGPARRLRG